VVSLFYLFASSTHTLPPPPLRRREENEEDDVGTVLVLSPAVLQISLHCQQGERLSRYVSLYCFRGLFIGEYRSTLKYLNGKHLKLARREAKYFEKKGEFSRRK
jgi:hypothetical protein